MIRDMRSKVTFLIFIAATFAFAMLAACTVERESELTATRMAASAPGVLVESSAPVALDQNDDAAPSPSATVVAIHSVLSTSLGSSRIGNASARSAETLANAAVEAAAARAQAEEEAQAQAAATPPPMTDQIMGGGIIPAEAMVDLYNQSGAIYPGDVYASYGAPTIEDFVAQCIEEANAEGVRPEVLFAQVVHETGWLEFGGQVSPSQCNFGGLGATNDGAAGASFASVRDGLRAQVQHLKAYASTDALANPVVDPRFDLVQRGSATTVYDLGGTWAYPGDTYGEALMQRMQDMYRIAY